MMIEIAGDGTSCDSDRRGGAASDVVYTVCGSGWRVGCVGDGRDSRV